MAPGIVYLMLTVFGRCAKNIAIGECTSTPKGIKLNLRVSLRTGAGPRERERERSGGSGDGQEREALSGPKRLREPVRRRELRPLVVGVVRRRIQQAPYPETRRTEGTRWELFGKGG